MEKQSYQSGRGETSDERHEGWRAAHRRHIIGAVGGDAALTAGKMYRGKMGWRVRIPLTPGSPPPSETRQQELLLIIAFFSPPRWQQSCEPCGVCVALRPIMWRLEHVNISSRTVVTCNNWNNSFKWAILRSCIESQKCIKMQQRLQFQYFLSDWGVCMLMK